MHAARDQPGIEATATLRSGPVAEAAPGGSTFRSSIGRAIDRDPGVAAARGAARLPQSLPDALNGGIPCEVIVILSGASQDVGDAVRKDVSGERLHSSRGEPGLRGRLQPRRLSRARRMLIFLNDDAVMEPGWLDWLVGRPTQRTRAPSAAACCSGRRHQEAGSVIWSDGSTCRSAASAAPHDVALRAAVDYVSACSLLVARPRGTRSANGSAYPAYYEDVDLCAGSARCGSACSSSRASASRIARTDDVQAVLTRRNRRRIVAKWSHGSRSTVAGGAVAGGNREPCGARAVSTPDPDCGDRVRVLARLGIQPHARRLGRAGGAGLRGQHFSR